MSNEDLLAKYRYCAEMVLPSSRVERSIELISGLDRLHDMGELVRVLDVKA